MKTSIAIKLTALATLLLGTTLLTAAPVSDLEQGFTHPPDSARPWVYWFPLDGNITSNGITLDLEAMKRAGIGGVLYMETDQGAPRGPAKFGGPLWRNLFKHICAEANRLGLQVNMNNDAGWCGSGGLRALGGFQKPPAAADGQCRLFPNPTAAAAPRFRESPNPPAAASLQFWESPNPPAAAAGHFGDSQKRRRRPPMLFGFT